MKSRERYNNKEGTPPRENLVYSMDTAILIFEILLLVAGVFLVAAVLMQQGKAHGLSGAIAGGAETFFGKEKGKRYDRLISRWTTIIGAPR